MLLYRIISKEEWIKAIKDEKVPRCNSDKRDNCVHLTKFSDIKLVSGKYFVEEEAPVVLEVDISGLENKLSWQSPTIEKPWHQPNLHIENIELENVKRLSHLIYSKKNNEFEVGDFEDYL